MGSVIDSHDVVIRFNDWRTYGHEVDCGLKTNVWVLNSHWGRVPMNEFHWKHFRFHWEKLQEAYETLDLYKNPMYEQHKCKELWIVPSVCNPCTLITSEHLVDVPEWVQVRELHDELNYNHIKKEQKLFTTGFVVIKSMVGWKKYLDEISIIGFGSNNPTQIEKSKPHYYDRIHDDRVADTLRLVHDVPYEKSLIDNWIKEGSIKRLEDESDARC
jgi:hypothetical protein